MVLLTSSAISVLISSSVVCIFTFLLFLSGYVLQQQTVRSLQEALRQPAPPKPTPTLPLAFQTVTQSLIPLQTLDTLMTAMISLESVEASTIEDLGLTDLDKKDDLMPVDAAPAEEHTFRLRQNRDHLLQIPVNDLLLPKSTQELDTVEFAEDQNDVLDTNERDEAPSTYGPSSAYIFSVLEPRALCSALLFAKHHTKNTKLPFYSRPSIILLYPSTWETHSDPAADSALDLLRSAIDLPTKEYGQLILHPVAVNPIWTGPGMLEGQLLAELQRGQFPYDRMIYLRLPGLAINIPTLDAALQTSDLRRSWSKLSTELSSKSLTSSSSISPPVLMVSFKNGLLVPRSNLRELTTSVSTEHSNHHENEMDVEAKAARKGSAWVLFDEAELEHRRGEKEWYGGVVERFERGRREICAGSGLL